MYIVLIFRDCPYALKFILQCERWNVICLLIFTDTMHNPVHRLNVDEIFMIIQLFAKFKPDYKFDMELLF